MLADVPRLQAAMAEPVPDWVLVSRRQLRSLNSWMHNVDTLVRGKERCTLQLHVDDAARLGIAAGDLVEVRSASGVVQAPAEPVADIRPGVVCLPHGWGHGLPGTRLQTAAAHPGVNINLLSPGPLVDEASGNAVLNGIPVQLRRVAAAADHAVSVSHAA